MIVWYFIDGTTYTINITRFKCVDSLGIENVSIKPDTVRFHSNKKDFVFWSQKTYIMT